MEITPDIMRDIERGLKCSRRERDRVIRIFRMYKVPVTRHVEKILAEMDKYLADWFCVVTISVVETYTIEDDESVNECEKCKPVKQRKKTKKRAKVNTPVSPNFTASSPTTLPPPSSPTESAPTSTPSTRPQASTSPGKSSIEMSVRINVFTIKILPPISSYMFLV